MRKITCYLLFILIMVTVTGCGYTREEKKEMKRYEKQGCENAKNYIKEKYGFDAEIKDLTCEKSNSGAVPDFSPSPTGNVFVKMKYHGEEFYVVISGETKNTNGIDNYQLPEITTALKQELYEIMGVHAEGVYVSYGASNDEKNGMIHAVYDGENLAEILQDESPKVAVSCVDYPINQISVSEVSRKTGVDTMLLVDYESQKAYQSVRQPYYNLDGWPIETDIEDQLYQVNGYRVVSAGEDNYMKCEKKIHDDIILITEKPEERVDLEKTVLDSQDNWNGNGFIDAKQVADAYAVETDSEKIYVYFPVGKLHTKDVDSAQLVKQYRYQGKVCYDNILGRVTDDGKYIHGIVYTGDESEIKISVFVDQK